MELKTIEQTDSLTLVAMSGRVDSASVAGREAEFMAATADWQKPTILDMSEVSFLASVGIRLLIACARALRASKSPLVIMAPRAMAADTLKAAGIDQVIPIAETKEDALALIQAG